ncbi:hypothetical protein KSP9073_01449 [Kushneria phyllosphaerae]|uniref:Uncharacterized protein n=2 Tax=Kushneria phyllosphaerae TaxID=2100822 RepID=A0A2R8CKK9_9GAMM|nr:hypothetical protein KSP9073_01449 [Kushneria phyllosphaerae]
MDSLGVLLYVCLSGLLASVMIEVLERLGILYKAYVLIGAADISGLLVFIAVAISLPLINNPRKFVVIAIFVHGLLLSLMQVCIKNAHIFGFNEPSSQKELEVFHTVLTYGFLIAFVGILVLSVLGVLLITLDPTSKTSDAPTAPVPSDLARDLRLSRSRARRSRVGR